VGLLSVDSTLFGVELVVVVLGVGSLLGVVVVAGVGVIQVSGTAALLLLVLVV
jgi:hypothetical protein